ncbi:MAG TPA: glycogen synthase [Actinomycetota bacterium]
MRVTLVTREYPPEVYGGAGVHVEYLSNELSNRIEVAVRCFGAPRPPDPRIDVRAVEPWPALAGSPPFDVLGVDLAVAAEDTGAELVHSHTWYANMGGHLSGLAHGVPHVMTSHSLEPLRPWKAEQLGAGGYALSSWCERTAIEAADAVIAVSGAMRDDVLRCYPAVGAERVHVIHNGIDADEYQPVEEADALVEHGVDPGRPSVVFVGRITRQKGIVHLVRAAPAIDPEAQIVLLAGAPDTPEIGREMAAAVEDAGAERDGIVWIDRMLPKQDVIQFLSHATVFVCPSVYEPLGIVNLEAMACETAVVASAVGGIPEVVDDGTTGLLVPVELLPGGEPADPGGFSADLASAVNDVLGDPRRAADMGVAGRRRVLAEFTWSAVADRTVELYRSVLAGRRPAGTHPAAMPPRTRSARRRSGGTA